MNNRTMLARAILEALAYSDIFDYPLRLDELHRYLPLHAAADELPEALASLNGQVGRQDGFYFLGNRAEVVEIRREREARSKQMLPLAMRYGRVLGSFPFVRMVALTGSLAAGNAADGADFDYMLVTAPGRLWTARAFAVTFGRIMRPLGHVVCVNLLITEKALAWNRRDLYTAREFCQMLPVTGLDVHQRLMRANRWTEEFLPNVETNRSQLGTMQEQPPALRRFLELPLRGRLGDALEKWLMKLQLRRIARRSGAGEETVFTADVCQGNFHHHRKRTQEAFEKRLSLIASSLPDEGT
ncbi:MAG: hypothetical protein AB1509_04650 [Chloroflexota bacterium]